MLLVLVATTGIVAVDHAGTVLVVRRDVDAPQAIVSLASHEWERLPMAARLAHENPDAIILLTQPVKPTIFNCHLCADRTQWLAKLGVDRRHVLILPMRVVNTYDEAVAASQYCAQHGVMRLAVVTSPYHTRRALATFVSVFDGSGTAIGIYPASRDSPARPDAWWWSPYDRSYVRYEWAALAWYAVRHQVSPFVHAS